jgi:hypothetical protein
MFGGVIDLRIRLTSQRSSAINARIPEFICDFADGAEGFPPLFHFLILRFLLLMRNRFFFSDEWASTTATKLVIALIFDVTIRTNQHESPLSFSPHYIGFGLEEEGGGGDASEVADLLTHASFPLSRRTCNQSPFVSRTEKEIPFFTVPIILKPAPGPSRRFTLDHTT